MPSKSWNNHLELNGGLVTSLQTTTRNEGMDKKEKTTTNKRLCGETGEKSEMNCLEFTHVFCTIVCDPVKLDFWGASIRVGRVKKYYL